MQASTFIAAAILMLSALPSAAFAGDHDDARNLRNAGTIVPLEQITARVREQHPGRILEVELEADDQRYYYEVEVVDEAGIVRKLKYDATTGTLIDESVDDN